jgi:hypothetical protein
MQTFLSDGVVLGGEFLSAWEGKAYVSKADGTSHTPAKVELLTSSGTMTIEYDSMGEALAALGGALPERLARVVLPVYAQGSWDQASNRRGPVFLRGRKVRVERAEG